MAEKTDKQCVKISCALWHITITTDRDACISCGGELQQNLATMFDRLFGTGFPSSK